MWGGEFKTLATPEIFGLVGSLSDFRNACDVRTMHLVTQLYDRFKMTFDLSGSTEMGRQFKLIKEAQKAYIPSITNSPTWTQLRNGLIAPDIVDVGMTLRQAAEIIYGRVRFAAEWTPHTLAMKDRLRSRFDAARKLGDGGYRDLLMKKTGRYANSP